MNFDERLRALIHEARTTGDCLTLAQISRKTKVKYKRIWHFISTPSTGRLPVNDAQRIYETLTGKSLFSDDQN